MRAFDFQPIDSMPISMLLRLKSAALAEQIETGYPVSKEIGCGKFVIARYVDEIIAHITDADTKIVSLAERVDSLKDELKEYRSLPLLDFENYGEREIAELKELTLKQECRFDEESEAEESDTDGGLRDSVTDAS